MKDRALTNQQKAEIILTLLNLWFQVPELRLGQLLECIKGEKDLFYIEDFELIKLVKTFINTHKRAKATGMVSVGHEGDKADFIANGKEDNIAIQKAIDYLKDIYKF